MTKTDETVHGITWEDYLAACKRANVSEEIAKENWSNWTRPDFIVESPKVKLPVIKENNP